MLVEEVLSSVNEQKANVNRVEKKLFEVVKVPLQASPQLYQKQLQTLYLERKKYEFKKNNPKDAVMPNFEAPEFKIPKFDYPSLYSIYKSNGGNSLSGKKSVGADFTPMQPKEFFDNILQTVNETYFFDEDETKPENERDKMILRDYLDLSTLEFNEYLGGSRIEFKIKMHPLSFKNDKGLNDITNLWLTFSTSYDGSKSNTISLYTERLVCLNGMVRSSLEGVLKGRNTIGGKAKILSYAKEVAQLVRQTEGFKVQMEKLDKIKLTRTQIERFKLDLLGFNTQTLKESDKEERFKKSQYEILELVEKGINKEIKRTGQTAFGLLQGVTYYTNHLAKIGGVASKTKVTREEYVKFTQGAKTNDKAQDLLFALVN